MFLETHLTNFHFYQKIYQYQFLHTTIMYDEIFYDVFISVVVYVKFYYRPNSHVDG